MFCIEWIQHFQQYLPHYLTHCESIYFQLFQTAFVPNKGDGIVQFRAAILH